MRSIYSRARSFIFMALSLCAASTLALSPVQAQQVLVVKPVTEKKVTQLPAGPLYWRVETFPTLEGAQTAAGPTSLAAEVSGKVWLMTLGAKGGATPGGSTVAEIGRASCRERVCHNV